MSFMDEQLPKGMNRIKDLGPIGDTARYRIRKARESRGNTAVELSGMVRAIGRDLSPVAIRRIEFGARRIDVDDLLALAQVLDISPLALVLPLGESPDEEFRTSEFNDDWTLERWWKWAHGEEPLYPKMWGSATEFRSWSVPSWYSERDLPEWVKEKTDALERENQLLRELTQSLLGPGNHKE